jgi:hypothetical protein
MTPADLLTAARDMLLQPEASTAGLWPRACAFLTRQALETAVDELWAADPATTGLIDCTMRSQLSCLPAYLDSSTAHRVAYVWAALSDACHYHAYELAPTAAELTGWINAVSNLIDLIAHVGARRP